MKRLLTVLFLVALGFTLSAQGTYSVTFTVDDGADPIEGAYIEVLSDTYTMTYSTNTDEDGMAYFMLDGADITYTITARDYEDFVGTYTVTADANYTVTMTMLAQYTVTFSVDMNTQIMVGDHVPGEDDIYIAGTFPGDGYWNMPGSNSIFMLEDSDADGIYSNTYTVSVGNFAYKFFQVFDDVASWDFGEYPGGADRTYTVTGDATAPTDIWNYEYLASVSVEANSEAVEGITVTIDGNTADTNAEGMAYFAFQDGVYTATTEWFDGWAPSSTDFTVAGADLDVDIVLSASAVEELALDLNVYPNPSKGLFNVDVSKEVSLEVFDITGRVLTSKVVNGSEQIQVRDAGVYFFRFSNENGSVTKKVIVQ